MGASARLDHTSKLKARMVATPKTGYDSDDPVEQRAPFDWAAVDMDLMAAAPTAVLCAGDMFSLTMDTGGNSVLVTVFADNDRHKKWCNDAQTLNKHLLRVYDNAVARQNARNAPKLPGMTG